MKKIHRQFPTKNWSKGGLQHLVDKIDATGSIKRITGSGRPKSAINEKNVEAVEELILSQEEQPGSHKSQRKIAASVKCSQSSVSRISRHSLGLTAYKKVKVQNLSEKNKQKRLRKGKKLL